jgi:hypothetical protein
LKWRTTRPINKIDRPSPIIICSSSTPDNSQHDWSDGNKKGTEKGGKSNAP